ncbi:hypothetical protein [Celeribacter naphthalenivorans]|uniref:hypothetical protein n=1 Tax=Celeribacter naphthalenivorans TaxID=1614694 RepID=UPI001CFC3C36|nr:hypothetical protein [Celeribacter naphthalenivorans]
MSDEQDDSPQHEAAELKERGSKWMEKIRAALKRDEEWRKAAADAEKIYECKDDVDFNILFSNVETIVPSLYNSTAIPDVRAKNVKRENPAYGTLTSAAKILERSLEAMVDDDVLDTEIEASVQNAYVAGRGVVRVRFDADVYEETTIAPDEFGQPVEAVQTVVENERVIYEVVPWADYLEGPGARFDKLPWVAFRHTVQDEDMDDFDAEMIKAQQEANFEQRDEHTIWEIWDKSRKSVCFVRESDGVIVMEKEDPLGLSGFFPVPHPVEPIRVTGKRTPVVPYEAYRSLAKELDRTTVRINAITKGLKVKGGFVGNGADLEKLADADDNTLVPIEDAESLLATGGLEKGIVWWPIDKAITVLRELYVARDQTKQAIYEITGISDIVRGASKSSETATAQQIKTQWGSLRIKRPQSQIERQVRDLFVMTSELIMSQFSAQRLQELSGEQVTPEIEALFAQGLKQCRVDVESDSTVRGDLTRQKGEMGQFLQSSSGFFQAMAPVVQQGGPQLAGPMIALYSSFARMFNIGSQGEDALDQLIELAEQAASQPQDDQKKQLAQAMQQLEMMLKQLEAKEKQAGIAKTQSDIQIDQREQQLKEAEFASGERDKALGVY